jgi:hypothetical protein
MSDISTFIRRGQNGQESINKLQALITPLAFPDPEDEGISERIILSNPVRLRSNTVSAGLDLSATTTDSRDRTSTAITLLPDTSTPSAFPVSETVSGTLDLLTNKKFGAGATFNKTQYISIPDDNQLDLSLPYFTMAFWYKGNGVDEGNQTIWDKGQLNSNEDFCAACTDFAVADFQTTPETSIDAGLQVQLQGDVDADFESASSDFDTNSFQTTAINERIKIVVSDGTNFIEGTVDLLNLYDGNWHSIVIISEDSQEDFCSACTDFDTGDFLTGANPVLTIYMDKVSMGTIDHSSVTGDLSNTSDAILGAEDTSLTNPLNGTLALWEYQAINWTTDDIDSFHDDARIRVSDQKAAFHFTGNDSSESTLETIAF